MLSLVAVPHSFSLPRPLDERREVLVEVGVLVGRVAEGGRGGQVDGRVESWTEIMDIGPWAWRYDIENQLVFYYSY